MAEPSQVLGKEAGDNEGALATGAEAKSQGVVFQETS